MVHILEGVWNTPWSVTLKVISIKILREGRMVQIQHVLRERNTLAGYFANLAVDFAGIFQVNNFQDIPNLGRIISNLDKYGVPIIRTKQVNRPSIQ